MHTPSFFLVDRLSLRSCGNGSAIVTRSNTKFIAAEAHAAALILTHLPPYSLSQPFQAASIGEHWKMVVRIEATAQQRHMAMIR